MAAEEGPRIDLLVLPCAGASATMYLRWRRSLPQWLRLVPLELPGRGSCLDQDFLHDFDHLVSHLSERHAASLSGRYVLFGHSMGALLAYGIAQRQRLLARPQPLALVVSASPAPSRRDPARFAGKTGDAALIADLRKQGGTPEEVFANAELLRITLDTLDADYRVCKSFRHTALPPLPMPVHVLAGRDDDIDADQIESWRAEAGAGFSLQWFDGGHFFIRAQEQQVLAALEDRLRQVSSGVWHASGCAA